MESAEPSRSFEIVIKNGAKEPDKNLSKCGWLLDLKGNAPSSERLPTATDAT
jgi:hypothetical protein